MTNLLSGSLGSCYRVSLLATLLPVVALAGGEEWARYRVGDHVEVSPICSDSWWPATIQKIEATKDPKSKTYTIKRDDGGDASSTGRELSFVAPGYVAPCVRAAGAGDAARALLPAPMPGVYECNYRGQIAFGSTFALLDKGLYRDYDGNRGRYRYDTKLKVIVFETGPKVGYRARQESAKTFQILDVDGSPTGNYCPHNPARDPNGKRL